MIHLLAKSHSSPLAARARNLFPLNRVTFNSIQFNSSILHMALQNSPPSSDPNRTTPRSFKPSVAFDHCALAAQSHSGMTTCTLTSPSPSARPHPSSVIRHPSSDPLPFDSATFTPLQTPFADNQPPNYNHPIRGPSPHTHPNPLCQHPLAAHRNNTQLCRTLHTADRRPPVTARQIAAASCATSDRATLPALTHSPRGRNQTDASHRRRDLMEMLTKGWDPDQLYLRSQCRVHFDETALVENEIFWHMLCPISTHFGCRFGVTFWFRTEIIGLRLVTRTICTM
jgi:hypothetical protein